MDKSLAARKLNWGRPTSGIHSEKLTPKETKVLEETASGKGNKQIARSLGISENTTKIHLNNINRKLGTLSRLDAVLEASRRGLIRAPTTSSSLTEDYLVKAIEFAESEIKRFKLLLLKERNKSSIRESILE